MVVSAFNSAMTIFNSKDMARRDPNVLLCLLFSSLILCFNNFFLLYQMQLNSNWRLIIINLAARLR